jgi:hypothetical protein
MVAVHIQAIGRGSDKVLGPIRVGPWHHQNVDLRQQVELVFGQLLGQSQRGFAASRFIAMLLTQNQDGGPVILESHAWKTARSGKCPVHDINSIRCRNRSLTLPPADQPCQRGRCSTRRCRHGLQPGTPCNKASTCATVRTRDMRGKMRVMNCSWLSRSGEVQASLAMTSW